MAIDKNSLVGFVSLIVLVTLGIWLYPTAKRLVGRTGTTDNQPSAVAVSSSPALNQTAPTVNAGSATPLPSPTIRSLNEEDVKNAQAQLAKFPNNPAAYVQLGITYLGTNQPDKAVAPLEKAVQLDPKNLNVKAILGQAYCRVGQLDKAKEQAEAAKESTAVYESNLNILISQGCVADNISG